MFVKSAQIEYVTVIKTKLYCRAWEESIPNTPQVHIFLIFRVIYESALTSVPKPFDNSSFCVRLTLCEKRQSGGNVHQENSYCEYFLHTNNTVIIQYNIDYARDIHGYPIYLPPTEIVIIYSKDYVRYYAIFATKIKVV